MNLINSVILDGTVTIPIKELKNGLAYFVLSTEESSLGVEDTFVACYVSGSLSKSASTLKIGDNLRVVGHLANTFKEFSLIRETVLVVEHLEKKSTVIKSGKYTFTKE